MKVVSYIHYSPHPFQYAWKHKEPFFSKLVFDRKWKYIEEILKIDIKPGVTKPGLSIYYSRRDIKWFKVK